MLSFEYFRNLVDHYGVEDALARQDEYIAACAGGNAEAKRLSQLEPGPVLAAGLIEARRLLMDDNAKVLIYACWEKQKAWTEAQQIAACMDVLGDGSTDQVRRVLPDLAIQSRLSDNSMGSRAAMSMQYLSLQRTWEAMNAGQLTSTHGWMMTTVMRNVPRHVAEQVDANVVELAIAKGMTPAQLGAAARLEVMKLDPEGAAERAELAKKIESDVRFSPDEDEMARLCATGDAWTTRQMMDQINRRADEMQRSGDDRSVGERRVGALSEAVLGEDVTLDEPSEPLEDDVQAPVRKTEAVRRPKRATALLLVSLPTLLGGSGPAQLDGYGPITAELARKIAASDVNFRRLVFDPLTGLPVEVGDRYELPQPVRRWLDARDRTCLFPSCQKRAVFCDADHAVEFPHGESTCTNCGLLCRKHHNLKTDRLWKLRRNDDNSVDWESPLGFTYHREASTYEEFLDSPDPPAFDDQAIDDPDPPPEHYNFSLAAMIPPPPQDAGDVEYDAAVASGEWRPITPKVAKLIADRAA